MVFLYLIGLLIITSIIAAIVHGRLQQDRPLESYNTQADDDPMRRIPPGHSMLPPGAV